MFGRKAKETRIKIEPANWPSNNWDTGEYAIYDIPLSLRARRLHSRPTLVRRIFVTWDQFRFLRNCPPTPPLSQHFALSEN